MVHQQITKEFSNATIHVKSLADGGDGSLEIIQDYVQAEWVEIDSFDPLGRDIKAKYLLKDKIAYIELSICSGIALLLKDELDPLLTSTYGTGVLIRDAIQRGAKNIKIFLGGSATIDVGTGILHALGVVFYAENQRVLFPNGGNLEEIVDVDFSKIFKLKEISFTLINDVNNVLLGPSGAVHVYGPQKGLLEEDIDYMEDAVKHYSNQIEEHLGKDISKLKGGGAAGGVSAGMSAFLEAKSVSGADFFMELLELKDLSEKADYIITGEGQLDNQTMDGKLVGELIRLANENDITPLLICGRSAPSFFDTEVMKNQLNENAQIFPLDSIANSYEDSIENAANYIPILVESVITYIHNQK